MSGFEGVNMEIPVIIEPLPNQGGFTARLGPPFDLTAQAATAEEARLQVTALLQHRLEQGLEVRAIYVPVEAKPMARTGWLPDDELTQEWLQHVQDYRAECDAADRRRILGEVESEEEPS
jgi:predicted RNase H-like HicB family nuclease